MALAFAILILSASHGWGMRTEINRRCGALLSSAQCDGVTQKKCPTKCAELAKASSNQAPEKGSIISSSFCDKVQTHEDCKGSIALKCKDKCDSLNPPQPLKSGSRDHRPRRLKPTSFCDNIASVDQCKGLVLKRCEPKCDELRAAVDALSTSETWRGFGKVFCQAITIEQCRIPWVLHECATDCTELQLGHAEYGMLESEMVSGVDSQSPPESTQASCETITVEQCVGFVLKRCEARCQTLQAGQVGGDTSQVSFEEPPTGEEEHYDDKRYDDEHWEDPWENEEDEYDDDDFEEYDFLLRKLTHANIMSKVRSLGVAE